MEKAPKTITLYKRLFAAMIDLSICFALVFIPHFGFFLGPLYIVCRDGLHLEILQNVSIGKSIMGLKVVSYDNGEDLDGIFDSIKRNCILLFPLMLPTELFFILYDRDSRRLGDRIAGSWVVETASNTWLEVVNSTLLRLLNRVAHASWGRWQHSSCDIHVSAHGKHDCRK
jgi:uncharacterized RDD family membrane protein YckC